MASLNLIAPMFAWTALDEPEREHGSLISRNLCHLQDCVEKFADAAALIEFIDRNRLGMAHPAIMGDGPEADALHARETQLIRWKMLAARDAAVTLYNYHETRQTIDQQVVNCPIIKDNRDTTLLRKANNAFRDTFDGFDNVRTGVAHSGALFRSPKERRVHVVPGTSGVITPGMSGSTMFTSVKGMGSVTVDAAHAAALEKITALIFEAYKPVEEAIDNIARERRRQQHPARD